MRTGLLLGLYATLTAVRVLGSAYFRDVANDALSNGANRRQKQSNTEPVVPHVSRDHVVSLSEHFVAEASFEPVKEARSEFVTLRFHLDGVLKLGVKLERTLTVDTDLEVLDDLISTPRGQLIIKKAVQFFECFVAIGHVSWVGVVWWIVFLCARRDELLK